MLQILADLYMEQGKSDKGIYVYRELMKTAPSDKNVCLWQYNVAHLTLSLPGSSNGDKVAEIENLNKLYGALKPKKVLPAAEAQECHDNAAAMSGELARAYHSESAKTKNPDNEELNRLLQTLAWEAVVHHPLSGVKAPVEPR